MNETIEKLEDMDIELKNLLEDIESIKSTIDLFGKIVDEKILTAV